MVNINRDGFTLLSSPESANSDRAALNIIFVHGLRGHPRDTWTGPADANTDANTDLEAEPGSSSTSQRKGLRSLIGLRNAKHQRTRTRSPKPSASSDVFWPEQYLVSDIASARVWTYGYNADVIGGLFRSNNKNSVSQHGRDLAVRLEREIDNEDPIVFVAHSLGGIIVKDALHRSKACRSRTKFIVFLGTPHRGSGYANWGEIASNLVRVGFQDSDKRLLATLEVNGEVLDNIHEEFKSIVSEHGIKVHSFQEAHGITGMKGLHEKVVDDFSSKLDLPRELETVETIDANHMQMARCRSRGDARYRAISGVLKQAIRREALVKQTAVAESLRVEEEFAALSLEQTSPLGSRISQNDPASARLPTISDLGSRTVQPSVSQAGEGIESEADGISLLSKQALPSVSKRFIGRHKCLGELHDYFKAARTDGNSRIAVLLGTGGEGKTQTALKYINDHQSEYQHVIWIDGTNIHTAQQSFIDAASMFGFGTGGRMKPEDSITEVKNILRLRGKTAPWLLVLDNLDDPDETYMAQVATWIPHARFGSITITTRLKAWKIHGAKVVKISSLSEQEAVQLLQSWVGLDGEEDSKKIVTRLGCMALAVNQAGAFISKVLDGSVSSYLDYYDAACEEMLKHGSKYAAEWEYWKSMDPNETGGVSSIQSKPSNVWAALELSFRYLKPDAAKLLTLISLLERNNVTVDIICRGASAKDESDCKGVTKPVDLSTAGISQWLIDLLKGQSLKAQIIRVNLLMFNLVDFSFVHQVSSREEQGIANQKFWIHPIVHDWARVRLKRVDLDRVAMEAICLVSHAIEDSLQFLWPQDANFALLAHLDFSYSNLLRLISDPELHQREHELLLQVAFRFGSLYRAHNRYAQGDPLLSLVWTHRRQGLDQSAYKTTVDTVNSFMAPAFTPQNNNDQCRTTYTHIHDLIPIIQVEAISIYHQGNFQGASSLICTLKGLHSELSRAQHECFCIFETLRIHAMVDNAQGNLLEPSRMAKEAYEAFRMKLGPTNLRTLFAQIGYLVTSTPESSPDRLQLLKDTAAELQKNPEVGPEASITRYAQAISSRLEWQDDPDMAISIFSTMLDRNVKLGVFSWDSSIPILDLPTLMCVAALVSAKFASCAAHNSNRGRQLELLDGVKDLAERAFRGYEKVLPMNAFSAAQLVCIAHLWLGEFDQAKLWYQKMRELGRNGGKWMACELEEFARIFPETIPNVDM